MTDQQPPHNLEFESAVLGAVLLTDATLPALLAVEGISPPTFYRPLHQRLFAAMVELHRRGDRVDAATVCDELAHGDDHFDDRTRGYVHSLGGVAPAPGAWRTHARRLVEMARFRARHDAAQRLAAAAMSEDRAGVGEAMADLDDIDRQATVQRRRDKLQRQEAVSEIVENAGGCKWTTPFGKLTDLLAGGLRPGQFTTLGGWAAHGKSVMAMQLLAHAKAQGARCALYTNEMQGDEIDTRNVSRDSAIPYMRLVQGKVKADEMPDFLKALHRVGDDFELIEAAGMTADEIAYDIRRERWDVTVIDLLNGLPGSSETRDIDHNVATLAACSRQASAHIIGCQHLNRSRAVGRDYPPEPVEADLRGSGQIFDLSNNVLFVYLLESEDEPGVRGTEALVKVAKARGGLSGRVGAAFQPNRMRFLASHEPGMAGTVAA